MPRVRDYSRLDATAFSRQQMNGLKVLTVGAGALGNEVLKNLALLGAGNITILDRDRIEASNLTRSVLFCTPDIDRHIADGAFKATVAAERVREINPDVNVHSHVGEIADLGSGRVRQADLVFCCLDNEMARLELSWVCTRLDRPLVDGGLGLINSSSGMVSLFPGANGPCYACRRGAERRRTLLIDLQGREDPCGVKERLLREADVVPTTPMMASIVAAFQVEVGLRHVFGRSADRESSSGTSYRITIHPRPGLETSTFERSPNCPLHDSESLIREVEERVDRVSDNWTAAQLLAEAGGEVNGTDAFVHFDWPITVGASCRACQHTWEPMLRRARFRRERCPKCASADVVETNVLTGLDASSSWAERPLTALGLPRGHIHEVVLGSRHDAPRRHVEVTGDLIDARTAAPEEIRT